MVWRGGRAPTVLDGVDGAIGLVCLAVLGV